MQRVFYKAMWGIIFVVGWAGVPTLSILLVTPLIAPLLPVGMAVVVPAIISGLCAGMVVKGLSTATKWYKKNYMNSELNKRRLTQELKPKKYQTKKIIIVVAKVISIVQPIYKYILKPIAKYLYKKITSKSEVKKLNERIDQIEKIKIDKEQMMTTLNLINKQQKAEIKDLSLIVEQELASIDNKIQKNVPLPKLIFLN